VTKGDCPSPVATVMSNLGLERHLASLGLTLERTAVGDRYVIERMRKKRLQRRGRAVGPRDPVWLLDCRRWSCGGDAVAFDGSEAREAGERDLPPLRAGPAGVAQTFASRAAGCWKVRRWRRRTRPPNSATAAAFWSARPAEEPVIRVMGEADDQALVKLWSVMSAKRPPAQLRAFCLWVYAYPAFLM
jgi:phosphoglucosamine mutase